VYSRRGQAVPPLDCSANDTWGLVVNQEHKPALHLNRDSSCLLNHNPASRLSKAATGVCGHELSVDASLGNELFEMESRPLWQGPRAESSDRQPAAPRPAIAVLANPLRFNDRSGKLRLLTAAAAPSSPGLWQPPSQVGGTDASSSQPQAQGPPRNHPGRQPLAAGGCQPPRPPCIASKLGGACRSRAHRLC